MDDQPKIIKKVSPVYPDEAKRQGISGTVVLEVIISEQGLASDIKAVKGDKLLVPAAIDALKQWIWEPGTIRGKPYPFLTTVSIRFNMK